MLFNNHEDRAKARYGRAKAVAIQHKSLMFRMFALLLTFLILLVSVNFIVPKTAVSAASKSELQAKNAELKKQAEALQMEINEQEADLKDQEAYIDTVRKKIDVVEKRVNLLNAEIKTLSSNIVNVEKDVKAKEANIVKKEEEIAEKFDLVSKRVRELSKSGAASSLQMILDSDTYFDFLVQSKAAERIALKDNEAIEEVELVIEAISKEKEELDGEKAKLVEDKKATEVLKNDADADKKELDVLYAKSSNAVNKAAKTLKSVNDKLAKNKKEQKQTDKEIAALINTIISSGGGYKGKYGDGTMGWPVPSIKQISSYFGPRWGSVHRGIDIANGRAYGENIVAAADGVVIRAQTGDSWGGGYGYHVIIDHGNDSSGRRITTMYAHCSAVLVSYGQAVSRGQVIGRIGSTGNSTGPHLHFEVRQNDVQVDPIGRGYIKG